MKKKKQPKRTPPHRLPTRAAPHPDDEAADAELEPAGDEETGDVISGLPVLSRVTDARQIRHFVSDLRSTEQQVGAHILAALQEDGTVAVLTAVVVGPDGVQRIVSAALDPDQLQQVQQLIQVAEEEREEEAPCVGFHCLLKRKDP